MFSFKTLMDKVHSHALADGISRLVALRVCVCVCSLTFRIMDLTVDP